MSRKDEIKAAFEALENTMLDLTDQIDVLNIKVDSIEKRLKKDEPVDQYYHDGEVKPLTDDDFEIVEESEE